ncbi:MAG: hypothetical protein GXO78_13970 [Calditrichaeota bacterium]|nr:hypothetical protein [Calditrichota bacterium]
MANDYRAELLSEEMRYFGEWLFTTLGIFRHSIVSIQPESEQTGFRMIPRSGEQWEWHLSSEMASRCSHRLRYPNPQSPTTELLALPDLDLHMQRQFYQQVRELLPQIRFYVRKWPWPFAKSLAISFTHDVDLTRKYGLKRLLRDGIQGRFAPTIQAIRTIRSGQDPYWVYPELLAFYRDRGMAATFFFLARSREGLAYRYNIRSRKFRRLLAQIEQEGHEIGLHTSLHAFSHPERIPREKKRLEGVIGHPLYGVRQHYLRVPFPEGWTHFHRAGFLYDSSVGLNRGIGLLAGTSFPYFPDPRHSEAPPLLEIPFAIMDYPWHALERSTNRGTAFVSLTQSIQDTHGHLCILWHPSNLAESVFRPLWERLVQWADPQTAFLAPLQQIASWWRLRNQIDLVSLQRTDDQYRIVLKTPAPVHGLTLEIFCTHRLQPFNRAYRLQQVEKDRCLMILPELPAGESTLTLHPASRKSHG